MRNPSVALAECCEFLDHIRRPVKESERVKGPYPYFGANGQQGWINDYLFDEPLVLIAEDGGHFSNPERGIAYKIKGKAWVNNHAHVLRPREGIIDVDYLAHALRNKDVRRHLSGSTRDKLTKAGACQIEIPLPPLEEQRRIAAILDKVVLLIAENRAGITLFSGTQEVLGSRVPRSRESG
jgi:restriction endonuclease S subunit